MQQMENQNTLLQNTEQEEITARLSKMIILHNKSKSNRKSKDSQDRDQKMLNLVQSVSVIFWKSTKIYLPQTNNIFENLKSIKQLKQFTLRINEQSEFQNEFALELSNSIKNLQYLEKISISISNNKDITSESIGLILSSISGLANLQSIRIILAKIEVHHEDFTLISKSFDSLIKLRHVQLKFINLKLIEQSYLNFSKILSQQIQLESLQIQIKEENDFNEECIREFMNAIKNQKYLFSLHLNLNYLNIHSSFQEYLSALMHCHLKYLITISLNIQKRKIYSGKYFNDNMCNSLNRLRINIHPSLDYKSNAQIQHISQQSTLLHLYIEFDQNFKQGKQISLELSQGIKNQQQLRSLNLKSKESCEFQEEGLLNLYHGIKQCKQLCELIIQIEEAYALCFLGLLNGRNKQLAIKIIHFLPNSTYQYSISFQKFLVIKDTLNKRFINEQGIKGLSYAIQQIEYFRNFIYYVESGNIYQLKMFHESIQLSPKILNFNFHFIIDLQKFKDLETIFSCLQNQQRIKNYCLQFKNYQNLPLLKVIHKLGEWKNLQKLKLIINQSKQYIESSSTQIPEYSEEQFQDLESLGIDAKIVIDADQDHSLYKWIKTLKSLKVLNVNIKEHQMKYDNYYNNLSKCLQSLKSIRNLTLTLKRNYEIIQFPHKYGLNLNQLKVLNLQLRKLEDFSGLFLLDQSLSQNCINLENFTLRIEVPLCLSLKSQDINNLLQNISKSKKIQAIFLQLICTLGEHTFEQMMKLLLGLTDIRVLQLQLRFDYHSYSYDQQYKIKYLRKNKRLVKYQIEFGGYY